MAAARLSESERNLLAFAVMCINKAKLFGLLDSDVATSPTDLTTLQANIRTARDRITVNEADRHVVFNFLNGWLQWAYGLGIIDNTLIAALTTVSGTAATTDLRYNFTNHTDWPSAFNVAGHEVLISPPKYASS